METIESESGQCVCVDAGSHRAEHRDGNARDVEGDETDDCDGGPVKPLQILDRQHEWVSRGSFFEEPERSQRDE